MSPNEAMEMMKLAIVGFVLVIPVVGFTVRFALRPLVEARAFGSAEPQRMLEQRMSRLEAEMGTFDDLRASVDRLAEELEFNRKLALTPAESASARSLA
jgi:hypothetical protein